MKRSITAFLLLLCVGPVRAQLPETYVSRKAISHRDTIVYPRIIRFDDRMHLFHVRDYFESRQRRGRA